MFWRYGITSLILLAALVGMRRLKWPGWQPVGFVLMVGVLSHGVWLSCVMLALERGVPSGIVALVVALQPMTTGAWSGKVTGESTPMLRWVGLSIGFAGVIVVLFNRIDFNDAQSVFSNLIPLVSVIAITVATLMERWAELYRPNLLLPADQNLFYQGLGTAVVIAFPAIFVESLRTDWSVEFIAVLLWLVFAVSLLAYALMWRLIARISVTGVASLFYFGPPVTMVMAWIAFGDTLLLTDLIGLGVVLIGVIITLFQAPTFDVD